MNKINHVVSIGLGVACLVGLAMNMYLHLNVEDANNWQEIFWFCNVSMIMLGIAFIIRSPILFSMVLISAVPGQFLWILDFLLNLFGAGFGRTNDLFEYSVSGLMFYTSVLFHVVTIPLALYGIWLYGFARRSKVPAFVFYLIVLLPATYIFTAPEMNINCVFYPCDLNYERDQAMILASSFYLTPYYLLTCLFFWFFPCYFLYRLGCRYFRCV